MSVSGYIWSSSADARLGGLGVDDLRRDRGSMVHIPGGHFSIGSPEWVLDWLMAEGQSFTREWFADETPQRATDLQPYWVDRHPVTVQEYTRFVEATGYITDAERAGQGMLYTTKYWEEVLGANWRHPGGVGTSNNGRMDHPVVHISWNDASAYADWKGMRLPSEAEWELAARGHDFRLWPWGNKWEPDRANTAELQAGRALVDIESWRSWWQGICERWDPYPQTSPVQRFRDRGGSPFGVWDMSGNVYEWTSSFGDFYDDGSTYEPIFQRIKGMYRVIRGGSWMNFRYQVRCSERMYGDPFGWSNFALGFRCARSGSDPSGSGRPRSGASLTETAR
jgi:formylglycine-generating enzyme